MVLTHSKGKEAGSRANVLVANSLEIILESLPKSSRNLVKDNFEETLEPGQNRWKISRKKMPKKDNDCNRISPQEPTMPSPESSCGRDSHDDRDLRQS